MLLLNQEIHGRSWDLTTEPRHPRRPRTTNLRENSPRAMEMTARAPEEGGGPSATPSQRERRPTEPGGMEERPGATLWERVRRCMLVEWCLAYSATGFVLLEAMDVFSDVWGWPLAVQKAITLLLGFGLLVTAMTAWFRSEGSGAKGWCVACGIDLLIVAAMIGGLVVAVQVTVALTG
jgi:hypothetical protein